MAKNIKQIFEQVRKVTPENLHRAQEWLCALEQDALNNLPWIDKLKGFMRGLWGAQVIEIEDLDNIDKILNS